MQQALSFLHLGGRRTMQRSNVMLMHRTAVRLGSQTLSPILNHPSADHPTRLHPARSFHGTNAVRQAKRDFYQVLGVSRDASKNDIKKQYYQLAKKFHPDTNKDDPLAAKKFAEATEAWEVLGDEEKRNKYDTFGHAGLDENGGGQSGASGFGQGFPEGFEDIFSSMFGNQQQQQQRAGQSRKPQAQRGADVQVSVRLSFMEAVKGTTQDINVTSNVECPTCDGSGAKPGTQPKRCSVCNGSGVEVLQQGFFAVETPCRRCHGQGTVIPNPCPTCRGQGTVRKARRVEVKIPEGVDHGMNLRLAHQGEAGTRGGPSGHLYVGIEVAKDPFFQRDGVDLHVQVPISIAQAILGGEIIIPTLTGKAELKIPTGTQPNTTVKMKNKGIKHLNSFRRGDQLVTFQVQVPRNLSPRQQELIEEFASEENKHRQCKSHSFADTVRDTVHRLKAFLKSDASASD